MTITKDHDRLNAIVNDEFPKAIEAMVAAAETHLRNANIKNKAGAVLGLLSEASHLGLHFKAEHLSISRVLSFYMLRSTAPFSSLVTVEIIRGFHLQNPPRGLGPRPHPTGGRVNVPRGNADWMDAHDLGRVV